MDALVTASCQHCGRALPVALFDDRSPEAGATPEPCPGCGATDPLDDGTLAQRARADAAIARAVARQQAAQRVRDASSRALGAQLGAIAGLSWSLFGLLTVVQIFSEKPEPLTIKALLATRLVAGASTPEFSTALAFWLLVSLLGAAALSVAIAFFALFLARAPVRLPAPLAPFGSSAPRCRWCTTELSRSRAALRCPRCGFDHDARAPRDAPQPRSLEEHVAWLDAALERPAPRRRSGSWAVALVALLPLALLTIVPATLSAPLKTRPEIVSSLYALGALACVSVGLWLSRWPSRARRWPAIARGATAWLGGRPHAWVARLRTDDEESAAHLGASSLAVLAPRDERGPWVGVCDDPDERGALRAVVLDEGGERFDPRVDRALSWVRLERDGTLAERLTLVAGATVRLFDQPLEAGAKPRFSLAPRVIGDDELAMP